MNNAVKELFDFMESNPDSGACGGCLFDGDGNPAPCFGAMPTIREKFLRTFKLTNFVSDFDEEKVDKGKNLKKEIREVGFIVGADLMLRKSVLDEVGIFDEEFFLYFEETELQFRIQKAGYKTYVIPTSEIIHLEGKSSSNRMHKAKIFGHSEYYFYNKCYGMVFFRL